MTRACRQCLGRSWLLGRLGGHLEVQRGQLGDLLALDDDELIAAVGGDQRRSIQRERARCDVAELASLARRNRLEPLCRCDPHYPLRLGDLPAPPAVLYVAGGLERFLQLGQAEPVAVIGARRASEYGVEVARSLGRGLATAGLTVVSGMARGIDAAAHRGALERGCTIAVLPGPAERPYPAGQRSLYQAILTGGVAVSELPCGTGVRKWCFLARNRLIAALAAMVVVVEAGERSGALPTADTAEILGRPVGAVPGRVTSAQARGPNALLATGATVVRDVQDVLDRVYGIGVRSARADRRALAPDQARLLNALSDDLSVAAALRRAGIAPEHGLAAISELELGGWIRRGPGSAVTVIP